MYRRVSRGFADALAIAVVALAFLVWAASAQAAPGTGAEGHAGKVRAAAGVLSTRASGLDAGAKPVVTVRGKGTFKVGALLRLRPGTYVLVPHPVRTSRGTRYTASQRIRVRVNARRTSKVTLRYNVLVAPRTSVLTVGESRRITAVTNTSLSAPTALARDLRPGSIVVAPPSPGAPSGLLRRVVSTSRQGAKVVATTTDATLRDALPEADFRVQVGESGQVLVNGQAQERRGAGQNAYASISRRFEISRTWAAGEREGGCSFSGVALKLTSAITPKATLDLSAQWRFRKPPKISLQSTIAITAETAINGGVTAGCSFEFSTPSYRFAAITFFVGPVPVVVTPALSAKAKLEFEGTATSTVDATFTGDVWGKISYDNGFRVEGGGSRNVSLQQSSFGDVGGKASASAGPELALLFYGGAGPTISATGGVAAEVSSFSNPWWTVDGRATAEVGGKLDVFGLTATYGQKILDARWRIKDSGGPRTPGENPPQPSATVLGPGITEVSSSTTGGNEQWGYIEGFAPGARGWLLSTGKIQDAAVNDPAVFASTSFARPGNGTLSSLIGGSSTYDAAAYRVTLKPAGDVLHVRYVFASEEYPEYVGSPFDDVMGVFVNGQNCAVVPGTGDRVSVNSINAGSNPQLFVDNSTGAAGYSTSMDGLTVPLTCDVPVTPGVPVDLEIAVADTSDPIYDSAVGLLDGGIWSD